MHSAAGEYVGSTMQPIMDATLQENDMGTNQYIVEADKTETKNSLSEAIETAIDKIKLRLAPEVQIYDHRYRMVREYISHNGKAVCVFNSL